MPGQDRHAVVDRMTLGETAEVDAHAGAAEAHGAGIGIEQQVAIADGGARRCEFDIGRANAAPVVVQVTGAGVRDVERAVGQFGERKRAGQQREQLVAHAHRTLRRLTVDQRQFRVFLVRTHQRIDAVHLGDDGVDRAHCVGAIVTPQFDVDGGAHDRLVAAEPARGGLVRPMLGATAHGVAQRAQHPARIPQRASAAARSGGLGR
jgi:hypothetical protein